MKIMTIFGTRPEIIRLSRVIPVLDRFSTHILVHTGQNYDPNLSEIFFHELGVRQPDIQMGVTASGFANQVGQIIDKTGSILAEHRPDRLLILGDTNSGLASIVAARMGIPVFHMEAGNRSYDNRVPEEINRRIIDHSSTVLLPYTHRSKENLLKEGIDRHRIFVVGNPIFEVLNTYADPISRSNILSQLQIQPGLFYLVTLHRAENVDIPERLEQLISGLEQIGEKYRLPIIVSLHPRTADKINQYGINISPKYLKLLTPLGFFDFIALEKNARCVITDSGTVQEEASIFRIPNITIRDVTERAETIECGSNILSGGSSRDLMRTLEIALALDTNWSPPIEYTEPNVSLAVTKVILGYHHNLHQV